MNYRFEFRFANARIYQFSFGATISCILNFVCVWSLCGSSHFSATTLRSVARPSCAPKPPQRPINDSFKQTPEQAAQPELPRYEKTKGKPEDNWVWTPQWQIDMHDPRWWGRVKFVK